MDAVLAALARLDAALTALEAKPVPSADLAPVADAISQAAGRVEALVAK